MAVLSVASESASLSLIKPFSYVPYPFRLRSLALHSRTCYISLVSNVIATASPLRPLSFAVGFLFPLLHHVWHPCTVYIPHYPGLQSETAQSPFLFACPLRLPQVLRSIRFPSARSHCFGNVALNLPPLCVLGSLERTQRIHGITTDFSCRAM